MDISVFGLGYVGSVSAACLAHDGHHVIGVDADPSKVELINRAVPPIVERDLAPMIERAVAERRLRATVDPAEAIASSELAFVCVGTPSQANGNLDLRYVRTVCEQIGSALATMSKPFTVVVRSTMLPGSIRSLVAPVLEEASGRRVGDGRLGLCINPEFMREGSAVFDFRNPPKTVIGASDPAAAEALSSLYAGIDAPLVVVDCETAEMVKYADNAWHALKVAFANEIGNIAKAVGVDSHVVMDIFCKDTKLNLSPYYLRPGFAFGGACLPKDVRALTYRARTLDVATPVLDSILPSNRLQIDKAFRLVTSSGRRRVGILGFAFKAGTDDLRESPMVELIERLIGKGYELRVYDQSVKLAALTGANKAYLLNHVPHIARLMVQSLDEVLEFAETVVVGNGAQEFVAAAELLRDDQILVDLVRVRNAKSSDSYQGICW